MRKLNVLAALTVLVCNLIVSFNHSLDLFRDGGFTGYLAYVAVIGCEITFVMGALNIVVSRMKGERPGAPAILGGLLGVALVGWSNVAAGWAYGLTGILLGLATPVSLVVAEMILSRAILQRSSTQPPTAPEQLEEPAQVLEDEENATDEETSKTPLEVAAQIYQMEGQPPGRKRLAKIAGCSEWSARQALERLKEKIA